MLKLSKKEMRMINEEYSVLMAVYAGDKESYLKQSIDSVIFQTVKPKEVVIACDGPLNRKLDRVLEQYEEEYGGLIKIVRLKENKGLGIALNEGLKECSCELVARMDSDDISMPDRMERELELMHRTGADIVSGTILEFQNDTSNIIASRRLPEGHDEIMNFVRRRNPFNHPAVLYKKSKVLQAGGYKDFNLFEDYCLWTRMLYGGCKGANLADPVLYMRAGVDMYKRRGGKAYARQVMRFRRYMIKNAYCTLWDFIVTSLGHTAIAIMPAGIRMRFYGKALRA